MKRNINYVVLSVILLLSLTGCATTTYMPLSKIPNAEVLGSIETDFESRNKVGMGALSYVGIGFAAVGGYFTGRGLSREPSDKYREGDFIVAGGFTGGAIILVLADALVNTGKNARINTAAREALLTVANEKYSEEEIDIREIQVTYVRALGRRNYLYNASGTVIKK